MPTYSDGEPVSSGDSYYGTVVGGDIYFTTKLRPTAWTSATDADKLLALKEATKIIDSYNYRGDKTDEDQELEFPRGGDTTIPEDVEKACYEIAFALLKGLDLDQELRNANIKRRKFGSQIETEYFGNSLLPSTGLLSVTAYKLLYPYFREDRQIELVRVS